MMVDPEDQEGNLGGHIHSCIGSIGMEVSLALVCTYSSAFDRRKKMIIAVPLAIRHKHVQTHHTKLHQIPFYHTVYEYEGIKSDCANSPLHSETQRRGQSAVCGTVPLLAHIFQSGFQPLQGPVVSKILDVHSYSQHQSNGLQNHQSMK